MTTMATMNLPPHSMDEHHFYMARSNPITFPASGEQLYERQNTYSDITIPQYSQYYYLGAPFAEQPTSQSSPDNWEFQPDPQHEGRWVAALQGPVMQEQQQSMEWNYPSYQTFNPGEVQYSVSVPYPVQSTFPTTLGSNAISRPYPINTLPSVPPYKTSSVTSSREWRSASEQTSLPSMQLPHSPVHAAGYPTPSDSNSTSDEDIATGLRTKQRKIARVLGRGQTARLSRQSYRCKQCGEVFMKRANLKEHERRHRSRRERAICTEPGCGKDYGRQADLARHNRSKHQADAFACRYCGKSFNRSDILRRHEQSSCKRNRTPQSLRAHNIRRELKL